MTESVREGQYKLIDFHMTTPGGNQLSLKEICAGANIYESILEPAAIADFEFYDAKGVFNHFVFTEQSIVLEWTTDFEGDSTVKYEFIPIQVDPVLPRPDQRGIAYKITCITPEAHRSLSRRDISLVREKLTCETVVKRVLEQLESEKPFFGEQTRGLYTFDSRNKKPFEFIDEIRLKKAMSNEFQGHAFVFFENSKGFVFKSIEKLIAEGLENIGDKYFFQSPTANMDVTASKWRNIIAQKIVQNGNQAIARRIGAGKNKVVQKNTVTGELEPFETDPKRLEFQTLNKGSISSSLSDQRKFSENDGKKTVVAFDDRQETGSLAEKVQQLPFFLSGFLSTIAHITVFGDTLITAGDVITCELPEMDGLANDPENPTKKVSNISAGNFLVTKCRHVLSFNEKAEYIQAYEIVKDGIGGELPATQ